MEAYFHLPLRDPLLVGFRQEVFRDLEDPVLCGAAERFTAAMARIRRRLEQVARMKHPPQAGWWFVRVVLEYEAAVAELCDGLETARARGLRALRDDLVEHIATAGFTGPGERARRLSERLGRIRYTLLLSGDTVTVAEHAPGDDFGFADRIEAAFARFRPDGPRGPRPEPVGDVGLLDQVEAGILDLVTELHPEVFRDLAAFRAQDRDFVSAEIAEVDRELRFYLAYRAVLAPLRAAGLPFCHPEVSAARKGLLARDLFDLALAVKVVAEGREIVGNDVDLGAEERILLVSGPNQGGKTTLSRAFGQLHHLAGLGGPGRGRRARVFLPDRIFTHYERTESLDGLVSKLEEQLLRMRAIIDQASPDGLIVLNEIFTATTSEDALALSRAVLAAISRLDAQCLWVTFLDELSQLDPKAVSMVSTLADDGRSRTYKLVRRAADGRADAFAIAEQHRLTYAQVIARMGRVSRARG